MVEGKPFYAPENKEPIDLLKNLNFPASSVSEVSLEVPVLFTIAKNSLMFKIYETEVV